MKSSDLQRLRELVNKVKSACSSEERLAASRKLNQETHRYLSIYVPLLVEELQNAREEVLKLLPKKGPTTTAHIMKKMRGQGVDENVTRMAIARLAAEGTVYPMTGGRVRRGGPPGTRRRSPRALLAM